MRRRTVGGVFHPQVTKTLYVDKNRTDSYVENGSILKPYKSFTNLLAAGIPSVSVVQVAPGYYYEDVDLSGLLEVIIIGDNTRSGDGTRIAGTVTISNIATKVGLKGISVQPATDKIALDYVDGDNCYFQDCVFRNPAGGAVQPVIRLGDVASGGGVGANTPRFYNCNVHKDGAGIVAQGATLGMVSFIGGFIDADISMIGAYGILLDHVSGSSAIVHNVSVLAIARSQIGGLTSAVTATPATAFLSLNQVTLRANDGVTVGSINLNGTCPYVMGLCDYDIATSNFGAGTRIYNSFDRELLNTSSVVGNTVKDALNRLYATTQVMTIYVDGAAGNDVTGDGSVGSPYKTITKAYEQVPYVLCHTVAIRIKAGTYTAFPNTVRNYAERGTGTLGAPAGGEGQLTFEGIDPPTAVAGPFTVTAVTVYNVSTIHAGQTLIVAGAGWTPDQYYGKFIKMTSGVANGRYFGIYSNTATEIEMGVSQPWENIVAGDTFEIVTPSVIVHTDKTVTFDHSTGSGKGTSTLGIINVTFKTTVAPDYYPYVSQGNGLIIFSLVAFKMNTSNRLFRLVGGGINSNFFMDPSVLVDAGHGHYSQNSFVVMGEDGAVPTTSNLWVEIGGGASVRGPIMLFGLICRNEIRLENSACYIGKCLVESVNVDHRAALQLTSSRIYQQIIAGAIYGIRVDDLSRVKLDGVRFDKVNADAILLTNGSSITLYAAETVLANTPGYGVRVGRMISMVFDAAKCILSGTTGDIYWNQTSAAVTFPAAGNSVTDGQGSRMTA